MSGPISIGVGGIAGWRIVQRSEARQILRWFGLSEQFAGVF